MIPATVWAFLRQPKILIGVLGLLTVSIVMYRVYHAGGSAVQRQVDRANTTAVVGARAADNASAAEQARADQAIRATRKEIDDATTSAPSAPITPRRRARGCAILRAQARAGGAPLTQPCLP